MNFKIVVFLLFIMTQQISVSAQWAQTDGPYRYVTTLALIPSDTILFSSTQCGYFSKTAWNSAWKLNGLDAFSAYSRMGDTIFYATEYDGFKMIKMSSPDDTATLNSSIVLQTLAHSGTTLFGGNPTLGFCTSTDFGNTWTYNNAGLIGDTITSPIPPGTFVNYNVSDIDVTSNYLFCSVNKGIFRLNPALNTWEPANTGLPITRFEFIQSFNDTLYVAKENMLYKSVNFGNSWELVLTAPSKLSSIFKINNQVFVGSTESGILYSLDNETTWNTFNTGLTDLHITAISYFDSTLICGTNSNGVFIFQNGQWVQNRPGMICSYISSLDTNSNNVLVLSTNNIYVSTDENTWQSMNMPDIPSYPYLSSHIGAISTHGDTVFISYDYDTPEYPFSYSYIKYTSNNGNTWNDLNNMPPNTDDDAFRIKNNNGRLYVFGGTQVFYTDDLGLNWSNISISGNYCNAIYSSLIHNGIPFVVTCGPNELLRFENQTWNFANNGLPAGAMVASLWSSSNALYAKISNYGTYVSHDNGNSWSFLTNTLSNTIIRDFAHKGSKHFLATDSGVYYSNDFGQNWTITNEGLKNLYTTSIRIKNDTLYVGTSGNGVWKQAIDNIDSIDSITPESLVQIYPNPASDYLFIATEAQQMSYKITDITGKIVISSQQLSNHKVNVSMLNNGLYFATFYSDKKAQTIKFVVSR